MELAKLNCEPCQGGTHPLRGNDLVELHHYLGEGWQILRQHHLTKEFAFPDFAEGLAFVNRVGALAEEQGHHPDVHLAWGKVRLEIWTHAIDGLTKSDFVLAAKCDELATVS